MMNSGGQRLLEETSDGGDVRSKKRYSCRKRRSPRVSTRIGKNGATTSGKKSRPVTPLLRWKLDEKVKVEDRDGNGNVDEDENLAEESGSRNGGWMKRKDGEVGMEVSARKLAAGLWRLQLSEVVSGCCDGGVALKSEDRLGFHQPDIGHVGIPIAGHHKSRQRESESEEMIDSPQSVSGPNKGILSKLNPSFQFTNTVMEGATKWDPICPKTADNVRQFSGYLKPLEQRVTAVSLVCALEAELEQARMRIQVLETDRKLSRRKIEHFLKKLSEERSEWRKREHHKFCEIIDDMKSDLNRERKNLQKMQIINSKLVKELAQAKLSVTQIKQGYEKERKDRELIEEVCEELAKEIEEDKTEVEDLKRESMNLLEEVEEERKVLQMTEVWREERVQMKLIDAKIALEEKYSQMNRLVEDLQTFIRSTSATPNSKEMREAETLRHTANLVNIEEITKLSYEPTDPNDIFSVSEDCNFNKSAEREIGPYKDHLDNYSIKDGDIKYQYPSSYYSLKNRRNVLGGSGSDWEEITGDKETPISQISEVCLVRSSPVKKASSISRLWKSRPKNGEKYKIISVERIDRQFSNGRISNGSTDSLGRDSGKLVGLSSSSLVDPHIIRDVKGCIELPYLAKKNSMKGSLLDAKDAESKRSTASGTLEQNI